MVPSIVRAHRRTQIRWAASETRICGRREAPAVCALFRLLFAVAGGKDREPQPRTEPMVRFGHGGRVGGQRAFVRRQMVVHSGLRHLKRMCSRVSVELSQPG